MTSKKEQVWSTTENKYVEVEIEGSREPFREGVKLSEALTAETIQRFMDKAKEQIMREANTPDLAWAQKATLRRWKSEGRNIPEHLAEVLDDPTIPDHAYLELTGMAPESDLNGGLKELVGDK